MKPKGYSKYSDKECTICGNTYRKGHRTKEQWEESKCCSPDCFYKSRLGVKRPDMVEILKENRKKHRGGKHWNWKGGITTENTIIRHSSQYVEWRKAVYLRDKWTCKMCKIKQEHPIAHHIKGFNKYPKLRFSVSNGITLCRSCHKKVHDKIKRK